MTDPRIDIVAHALHDIDVADANAKIKKNRKAPREWTNPWEPGNEHQLAKLRADATRIIVALDSTS